MIALVLAYDSPPAWARQVEMAAATIDARAAAHFLEQATFGPSAADVAAVQTQGAEAWLAQQFGLPESTLDDGLDTNQVRAAVLLNMANGPDQLRQRAMFAWSQVFVISANKTGSGAELTPWVRLLSRNVFGNYRTFLREVTLSPTMGKFLDLAYSRRASSTSAPNENYPREMLQLFSIGLWELNQDGTLRLDAAGQPIPTYTQDVIQNFARAMTGWTFPTMPGSTASNSNPQYFVGLMEPRSQTHDTGAKTLLNGTVLPANQSTAADMEAVIDNVFQHRNVPPFVATRLIRSLVTSNPTPGYIRRVADVFVNNGAGVRGDLRAVLTAVLLDPEAQTFAPGQGRLKDPILHLLGMGRALGAQISDANAFMYVFSNLSQQVLTPASVFSFYSPLALLPGHLDMFGPEFQIYPPALAIQRANYIYAILNNQFSTSFRVDRAPFTTVAADPATLVEKVNQSLMFGRMSNDLRQVLTSATAAIPVTDLAQRSLGALYLAAISSEYTVFSSNTTTAVSTVQPPTGLSVVSVVGNLVTLKWVPPSFGPPPSGYVIEGGVNHGDVLASLPTGSASSTFTFAAPLGSFYVRVHTLSGPVRSRASSEIRIHVGVPVGPTAPTNLLGFVKDSALGLSWRNTFAGGAPTSLVLDVSGALTTSIPLPVSETFAFPSVPPGKYTFSVRAVNAAGSSGSSNSVTLTFPTRCSGAPQAPTNFVASVSGNVVSLNWQSSASGNAATSYTVQVSGAYNAVIPTPTRTLSGAVGRGTYNAAVRAVNACGTSGASVVRTVVVP